MLQLASELGLTEAQRRDVQAIFNRMSAAAKPLGGELIAQEQTLDRLFANGEITADRLAAATATIAELQGHLRLVHLAAHLETRALLDTNQIARYQQLRGYGEPCPGATSSPWVAPMVANIDVPGSPSWLRLAGRAKFLSSLTLVWLTIEGAVGVIAGVLAGSIALVAFGLDSAIEGLASVIVIWRFTGSRTISADAERRAQKWVAISFFLLAPMSPLKQSKP